MKRRVFSLILFIIILSTSVLAVSAEVMPRLNNTAGTSSSFSISSTGKATLVATYDGYRNVTSGATITSYIEKRTLGVFWTKVDIDQPNNEWVDSSSNYYGAFGHEFQLKNTGTYRATIIYEISGTGGATDVIEYEQERTYS